MKCSICGYELDHKRNFIVTKDGDAICERCYSMDIMTIFVDISGKVHIGAELYPNINYYPHVAEVKEHE
jgi:hypothetical protein